MLTTLMEIRSITDDEVPAFRAAMITTFAGDPAADTSGNERVRALVREGRAWAAFDRGNVVATAGTFEQDVSMPGGGTLVVAGLTMVTVRPTHRRRGILRALIEEHLADARRRGEPCSGLWASEAAIYGRFGYGCAAEGDELIFDARGMTIDARAGAEDELHDLSDDDAKRLLPPVYESVRKTRAGMMSRSDNWWAWRRFRDQPHLQSSRTPRKHLGAFRDGQLVGWIAYRQRLSWHEGQPNGSYDIDELIAVDERAEVTLWRFASTVDLFPTVTYWNLPTDSMLPWLVNDRRRLRRRRTDTLWIRPDDLDRTLAARQYSADGSLRVDVDGNVHELRVDSGRATSSRVEKAPELRMNRSAVGAILLGNVAPSQLARAGLIQGDAAALARADRMFATATAPWCPEIF
jgi:predicted acetyltransferase